MQFIDPSFKNYPLFQRIQYFILPHKGFTILFLSLANEKNDGKFSFCVSLFCFFGQSVYIVEIILKNLEIIMTSAALKSKYMGSQFESFVLLPHVKNNYSLHLHSLQYCLLTLLPQQSPPS